MEIEDDSVEKEYDFSQGKRGAIDPVGVGKTRITIRIDNDVLVVTQYPRPSLKIEPITQWDQNFRGSVMQ